MDWWDQIMGLFKSGEESSPSNPLIHEVIQRSEVYLSEYENWKNKHSSKRLLKWLSTQYGIFLTFPDNIDEALDFLELQSSNGFVVHFHKTNYSKKEINFLFDFFKEQVCELGYLTQISDTRTYNRPNWVETVDRHYLKPRSSFMKETEEKQLFNQKYGNVMIELLIRDEKIHNLKFRATSYKDHLYNEASDFKELMKKLLG